MAGILLRLLEAGEAEMTWWVGRNVGGGTIAVGPTNLVVSPDERAALNRANVRFHADKLG